jgi:transcriptional regulator with XRE-family HTH domain
MATIKAVKYEEIKILKNRSIEIYPIKFKLARVIKGLTLEELECLTGVTRKTISKIEKGNCTRITSKTYHKLILALGQNEDFYTNI